MKVCVLTVSDRASAGDYTDESGPLVERMLADAGHEVVARAIVPDERPEIERVLVEWSDLEDVSVIVSTGGTGLGPRDVTPEAVRAVIDREAPGIGEAMRAAGLRDTPFAALSRQVAGARGTALIVAVPGSPKAASASLGAILDILPHAAEMLRT